MSGGEAGWGLKDGEAISRRSDAALANCLKVSRGRPHHCFGFAFAMLGRGEDWRVGDYLRSGDGRAKP